MHRTCRLDQQRLVFRGRHGRVGLNVDDDIIAARQIVLIQAEGLTEPTLDPIPDDRPADPPRDELVQVDERAAADEQDVLGVDGDEFDAHGFGHLLGQIDVKADKIAVLIGHFKGHVAGFKTDPQLVFKGLALILAGSQN